VDKFLRKAVLTELIHCRIVGDTEVNPGTHGRRKGVMESSDDVLGESSATPELCLCRHPTKICRKRHWGCARAVANEVPNFLANARRLVPPHRYAFAMSERNPHDSTVCGDLPIRRPFARALRTPALTLS
jgi:hypothetical protein